MTTKERMELCARELHDYAYDLTNDSDIEKEKKSIRVDNVVMMLEKFTIVRLKELSEELKK